MKFLKNSNAVKSFFSAILVVSALAVSSAHAALPAGVATMFTEITADFADLLTTYMYPLLLAVTGGMIIIGLVKKGAKKAAS